MSELEQRRGRPLYLTEVLSLLQLIGGFIRLVVGVLACGLAVLIFAEPYFLFAGGPKPGWLGGLESVYGGIWQVGTRLIGGASSSSEPQAVPINPNCTVQFVRFDEKGEAGRWTFGISQLDVLPQQATAKGVTWQNVQVKAGGAKGSTGWVALADLNATLAKPECR